jgi:hypothetical protein
LKYRVVKTVTVERIYELQAFDGDNAIEQVKASSAAVEAKAVSQATRITYAFENAEPYPMFLAAADNVQAKDAQDFNGAGA